MLRFDDNRPADPSKDKPTFVPGNWEGPSVKHSVEKPILLMLFNSGSLNTHFTLKFDI